MPKLDLTLPEISHTRYTQYAKAIIETKEKYNTDVDTSVEETVEDCRKDGYIVSPDRLKWLIEGMRYGQETSRQD